MGAARERTVVTCPQGQGNNNKGRDSTWLGRFHVATLGRFHVATLGRGVVRALRGQGL